MLEFKQYYEGYLGIKANKKVKETMIVESEYREIPLNRKYFYPIIVTEYNGSMIYSSSSKFFNLCMGNFDGTIDSVHNLLEILHRRSKDYRLRKMRRYSLDEDLIMQYDSIAEVLTEDNIRNIRFNIMNDRVEYIKRKKVILNEKRQFAVILDDRIVSTAFISDIHNNGCNIVVFSDVNYRRNGYGEEVVKACINWCVKNNLVPIYLLEESNIGSIKLAESLDLELKSQEWIISITEG